MSAIICTICQEFQSQQNENCVTPCGHTFHVKCVSSWLQREPSCPMCKAVVAQTQINRIYMSFFNETNMFKKLEECNSKKERLEDEHGQLLLTVNNLNMQIAVLQRAAQLQPPSLEVNGASMLSTYEELGKWKGKYEELNEAHQKCKAMEYELGKYRKDLNSSKDQLHALHRQFIEEQNVKLQLESVIRNMNDKRDETILELNDRIRELQRSLEAEECRSSSLERQYKQTALGPIAIDSADLAVNTPSTSTVAPTAVFIPPRGTSLPLKFSVNWSLLRSVRLHTNE